MMVTAYHPLQITTSSHSISPYVDLEPPSEALPRWHKPVTGGITLKTIELVFATILPEHRHLARFNIHSQEGCLSVPNDQKNYRDFFENSTDAMLIIENGRFVECNSAAVTMLGYNCKGELTNASPFNLSPELQADGRCSREKSIEMMQVALEQGNHRFEWNHIGQDGTNLQVEVSLTRVETEDGFQFFCVWHDITEHKQVEAAMVESEEIYKTILMASPDDITIADLSGRLLMFSDAATTMFGYDREEGPGMTIMDFIVPEDHEIARANMMKMVQQGHSGPNEYRAIRKDRSCFDIEVNSALIRDRQGKPFRMVLIARDITFRNWCASLRSKGIWRNGIL